MAAVAPLPRLLGALATFTVCSILLAAALYTAYSIRLYAVTEFGRVIHEFDPWFNFRATQYLSDNGLYKFFHWFDYMSWYPLGRPVGSTIYPGMQLTAVAIHRVLNSKLLGLNMSLNDVCVFVPAWFGVTATAALGALTAECAGSATAGVFAALIMAMIPAHIMRSVAGGYDNESIAVTSICLVFFLWASSLRTTHPSSDSSSATPEPAAAVAKKTEPVASNAADEPEVVKGGAEKAKLKQRKKPAKVEQSEGGKDAAGAASSESPVSAAGGDDLPALVSKVFFSADEIATAHTYFFGLLTGIAYIYMVMAWGGYVFVLNMVAFHAALLVMTGRYTQKLHRAYTLFYAVGTAGAVLVPVVGWTPLKSLEQLGAFVVFVGLQALEFCETVRKQKKMSPHDAGVFKFKVAGVLGVGLVAVVAMLLPMGYFGPISARVRSLFVKHTRTGNPLVDSVAEHQATSPQAYLQFLSDIYYVAPIGFVMCFFGRTDAKVFLLAYGAVAYYFSAKMSRLVILLGPIASALGGVALGGFFRWVVESAVLATDFVMKNIGFVASDSDIDSVESDGSKKPAKKPVGAKKASNSVLGLKMPEPVVKLYNQPFFVIIRAVVGIAALYLLYVRGQVFSEYCQTMARHMSHPSIMFKGQLRDGSTVLVDDYREGYWWLRDHTPEDSRVLSWWDYGYQITGIGNRTTLADGNTWNHEHIATIGKMLVSPEKEAHSMIRHVADFVLIWAGGQSDDLAKSPHMARIGNSVFPDICPNDPLCRSFGFVGGRPTKMMAESLLFKLHGSGLVEGVQVNPKFFREVFRSKFGKVRIYAVLQVSQKSKKWVADPANRLCDRPGSWYCPGQYPPALEDVIARRKNFAQLEDFNRAKDPNSKQYTDQYHKSFEQGG
eukprot:CAMPEP_0174892910 /NCGR_PEP_ID=MMETSP0167-20121228/7791_1 /TAXON_ID=38298 /ORGANISM="Rhodella maculata, Strain CCMP736" /LENGTH=889 /DNA_ID=CAMNT_0016131537 /DNA_START=252 /DNA_END=2921 /DNA_ORIENTATION=+